MSASTPWTCLFFLMVSFAEQEKEIQPVPGLLGLEVKHEPGR